MDTRELTAEQEDEALRIADIVAAGTRADALKMGRLLASRKNSALFGATEFEVRDAVQRIGTRALETALVERNKGGLRVWLRLSRLPGGYRIPGLPVETVMSLLGSIESPRAYDHCRHGRFPTGRGVGPDGAFHASVASMGPRPTLFGTRVALVVGVSCHACLSRGWRGWDRCEPGLVAVR